MTSLLKRKNIKVLVVDDSAVVRKILEKELNAKEGIEVVGTAADPYIAREKIIELNPDVLTLDIEMPRMDGITFLRKLMEARPMPVIILSSLGERNGPVALEALELGALDVVQKPGSSFTVQDTCNELAGLIRSAVGSRAVEWGLRIPRVAPPAPRAAEKSAMTRTTQKIIAIGASTGGVQSLSAIFAVLPATTHGIVVVQHMPPKFTSLFAQRMNSNCAMEVREAAHGDRILPGLILIAPGGKHMTISRSGAQYSVMLNEDPPVCHQRPSVDVLFNSVARHAGANAVGAILTGMGNDGAAGLLAMKQAGAKTAAQDEASSIVFGMPKEAIKLGGADYVLPLSGMAGMLQKLADD
jgi:two-component system chemotaxis response regulator CheB